MIILMTKFTGISNNSFRITKQIDMFIYSKYMSYVEVYSTIIIWIYISHKDCLKYGQKGGLSHRWYMVIQSYT